MSNSQTRVTIEAKTAAEIYAGRNDDGFFVFELIDGALELNDIVEADFSGHGSLALPARNITQDRELQIQLEDWEATAESAIRHLQRIGSPSRIWTLKDSSLGRTA